MVQGGSGKLWWIKGVRVQGGLVGKDVPGVNAFERKGVRA